MIEDRIVRVTLRSAYGRLMADPANPLARAVCALTGKKTIRHCDLENIRALGFTVADAAGGTQNLQAIE